MEEINVPALLKVWPATKMLKKDRRLGFLCQFMKIIDLDSRKIP
jgi:hypothetical protein